MNGTHHFDGMPEEVWNFWIGCYQPAQKWLKDRAKTSKDLDFDDVLHYQKVMVALDKTIAIMFTLDKFEFQRATRKTFRS